MHEKDRALLELILGFFGVGKIYKHGKDSIQLRVQSIKDLKVIIEHFNNYPLITQKRADFELYKQVVDLIDRKLHLTSDGLQQIVNIRASINNGLSDELKAGFPKTSPVLRPLVKLPESIDPYWIAGFTSAEGSFIVAIRKSPCCKSGVQVQLIFKITQHSRDAELLRSLVTLYGCGNFRTRGEGKNIYAGDFTTTKLSDITDKIIPFFKKYPIQGVKALDFADLCKAANIIEAKAHLTSEGLEEVRQIKAGMNRGRS